MRVEHGNWQGIQTYLGVQSNLVIPLKKYIEQKTSITLVTIYILRRTDTLDSL